MPIHVRGDHILVVAARDHLGQHDAQLMHLFRVHMLVGTERMLQMQGEHAVLAQPIRASFQVPDHRFGEHVRVMPLAAVARVYEPAAIVLLGIDDVTNHIRKIRLDLVPKFDHGHQYSPCTTSISAFSRSIPVILSSIKKAETSLDVGQAAGLDGNRGSADFSAEPRLPKVWSPVSSFRFGPWDGRSLTFR